MAAKNDARGGQLYSSVAFYKKVHLVVLVDSLQNWERGENNNGLSILKDGRFF